MTKRLLGRLLLAVTATFLWLLALSLLLGSAGCAFDSPTAPAPIFEGSADARTRPIERPRRPRPIRSQPVCTIVPAIPPKDGQYFMALQIFRPPAYRVDELIEVRVSEYDQVLRASASDEFAFVHVPIKCNGTVGYVRLRGWSADWKVQHWTLEFVDAEYRGRPPTCP